MSITKKDIDQILEIVIDAMDKGLSAEISSAGFPVVTNKGRVVDETSTKLEEMRKQGKR